MNPKPDFILTVSNGTNTWQNLGSAGDNATVANPTLNCNDCFVMASIFKNGDGFFELKNNQPFEQTLLITLGWLGVWQQTYTVVVPAKGKFVGIRDVP